MRDSGIAWVGAIPDSWAIKYLPELFRERRIKNKDLQEQNLLSLSYGKIVKRDIQSNEGLLPESYEGYNIVEPDNIVLRLTDLQNDHRSLRTGLCKERGIITSAYLTIESCSSLCAPYMHYLLHCYDECKVFYAMGDGVRQTIKYSDFKKLPLLSPPLTEQRIIAAFLDRKCEKIDTLISEHKNSIEKLKEYKLSLITETITKGLCPTTTMKDCGLYWVDKIPSSWTMQKLKTLANRIVVGVVVRPAELFSDTGTVPFLRGINIDEYRITPEPMVFIEEETNQQQNKSIIHKGDVLIVRDGDIGTACVVPNEYDGANVVSLIVVTCSDSLLPAYLCYTLNSSFGKAQFSYTRIGSALSHTSVKSVSNLSILLPPLKEQQDIVDYLDQTCACIDKDIKDREALIDRLTEYKKSLIYEVVTGKKEV